MFDGPDLAPLCLAPFVAVFSGLCIYGVVLLLDVGVEKITGSKLIERRSTVAWLCVGLIPIICIASLVLNIGGSNPPPGFTSTSEKDVLVSFGSGSTFVRQAIITVPGKGKDAMDFSGMGLMLMSCCFVAFIPPIVAGVIWMSIYAICDMRGKKIEKSRGVVLFIILYVLSVIASCLYTDYYFLQNIYVMG